MTATFKNWHKSSYSGGSGEDCVEQGVDMAAGVVGIRDTKKGGVSPVLAFSSGQWSAFVADVKANDRLTGGHTA
ncbi:DUF397 domain-containing protein [Streptomyces mirabilis]|uniref:DUF397 domain-containing protein n=1 Tax=Streptomyces mirabilis TaxID=68239 RepID=UPI00369C3E5E